MSTAILAIASFFAGLCAAVAVLAIFSMLPRDEKDE